MIQKGVLYMVPTTLGDSEINTSIPIQVKEIVNNIDVFIVENIRTARRYLKRLNYTTSFQDVTFFLLNEHSQPDEVSSYLQPAEEGKDIAVLSEAGCPAIADPGAVVARMAHRKNIEVIPLVGPSSLLLALMASGLNGQSFVFHGYLPKERTARIKKLQQLEKDAQQKKQTQLFMETPYRNQHLLEDIVQHCNKNTLLCIAADITLENEFIKTKTIEEWKKNMPDLHKRPTIFLM